MRSKSYFLSIHDWWVALRWDFWVLWAYMGVWSWFRFGHYNRSTLGYLLRLVFTYDILHSFAGVLIYRGLLFRHIKIPELD